MIVSYIRLKNVQFSYDETQVFKDLNFYLPKNKTLSIIGGVGFKSPRHTSAGRLLCAGAAGGPEEAFVDPTVQQGGERNPRAARGEVGRPHM